MNSQITNKYMQLGLLFLSITLSSCSNENNQNIADNMNNEFELTYRYVMEHMSAVGRDSKEFSSLRQKNKDAFTSIAYTWHSIATNECGLAESSTQQSNPSNYDRLTQKSPSNNYLAKPISNNERKCLANIYFSYWNEIQRMLSLSYPTFQ